MPSGIHFYFNGIEFDCMQMMTESDLQSLLRRAAWRSRLARAVNFAMLALIAALLLAAAIVLGMRWSGREFVSVSALAALSWILTAVAGIFSLLFVRPSLEQIATALDYRAQTQDHLATWLYLRALDATKLNATQLAFRDAQAQSTLRAASVIRLKTHAPISWPRWSRATWLALIILFSAVLIPPNESNAPTTREKSGGFDLVAGGAGGGSGKTASDTLRETPRIQILSPADRMKFELIAGATDLPEAMKCEALKDLTDAIGNIPESDLTAADRQLLEKLRNDVGQETAKPVQGSVTANGAPEKPRSLQPAEGHAADFKTFSELEKAWAAPESNFADVRDRLDKYYKGAGK